MNNEIDGDISILEFLKKNCSSVTTSKQFYYCPFWFEESDDGKLIVHSFDSLPPELVSAIENFRKNDFKI